MIKKQNTSRWYSRIRHCKSTRKGATSLEFALVAPALLIVIFVSFEFSRIGMMRSVAQCAAYESCRIAVVEGSTTADARAEAERILARLGTKNATIEINDGVAITALDPEIKVAISIPMEDNAFILSPYFAGKYINTEITLRTEKYTGYYDGGSSEEEE